MFKTVLLELRDWQSCWWNDQYQSPLSICFWQETSAFFTWVWWIKMDKIFIILLFCSILGKVANNPDCFVEGECTRSSLIDITNQDTINYCLNHCQKTEGCSWFTFDSDDYVCETLRNCVQLTSSYCSNCISGERNCDPRFCNSPGLCMV